MSVCIGLTPWPLHLAMLASAFGKGTCNLLMRRGFAIRARAMLASAFGQAGRLVVAQHSRDLIARPLCARMGPGHLMCTALQGKSDRSPFRCHAVGMVRLVAPHVHIALLSQCLRRVCS